MKQPALVVTHTGGSTRDTFHHGACKLKGRVAFMSALACAFGITCQELWSEKTARIRRLPRCQPFDEIFVGRSGLYACWDECLYPVWYENYHFQRLCLLSFHQNHLVSVSIPPGSMYAFPIADKLLGDRARDAIPPLHRVYSRNFATAIYANTLRRSACFAALDGKTTAVHWTMIVLGQTFRHFLFSILFSYIFIWLYFMILRRGEMALLWSTI